MAVTSYQNRKDKHVCLTCKDINLRDNASTYLDKMYFKLINCFNQNRIVTFLMKLHQ